MQEKGLGHTDFQSRHQKLLKQTPLGGHWQAFCGALLDPQRFISCKACSELRDEVNGQAAEEAEAQMVPRRDDEVEEEVAQQAAGERKHSKGRKRKDDKDAHTWLHRFIATERKGIYSLTDNSYAPRVEYYCHAREKNVNFWVATNPSKLHLHEAASQKHARGLKRLSSQAEEEALVAGEQALVPVAAGSSSSASVPASSSSASAMCAGVSSQDPTASLYAFRASLENFVLAGQPSVIFGRRTTR